MYLPHNIAKLVGGLSFDENTVGMSDSRVFTFPDMVLKVEKHSSESEQVHKMMKWLQGKLPIPRILGTASENGTDYLLMSKAEGQMSCAEEYMLRPQLLTDIMAEALRLLWSVDISDCPCSNSAQRRLQLAEYRVENGLVDTEECAPDTFGKNGFRDPRQLLEWLKENIPEEESVLSHGDLCLPNVFVKDGKLSCFIDLGRCGVGDKWNDIAILCRSLGSNFRGEYGGKVYNGYSEDMLFEHLGIAPDRKKMEYFRLLDELF